MEFQNESNLLIYQNQEGNIKIDVQLENDTVWLTQEQMAQLFGKGRTLLQNIFLIFSKKRNWNKMQYVGISDILLMMGRIIFLSASNFF